MGVGKPDDPKLVTGLRPLTDFPGRRNGVLVLALVRIYKQFGANQGALQKECLWGEHYRILGPIRGKGAFPNLSELGVRPFPKEASLDDCSPV